MPPATLAMPESVIDSMIDSPLAEARAAAEALRAAVARLEAVGTRLPAFVDLAPLRGQVDDFGERFRVFEGAVQEAGRYLRDTRFVLGD